MGYMPAGPFGADERDGQLLHLVFEHGPVGLDVGHDAERAEPSDVVRMDELEVRDLGPGIARTVGAPRDLDGVERVAHGAIADGMDVDLEPERIEPRDGRARRRRARSGCRRGSRSGSPSRSRYGSSTAPVKFSRIPSAKNLTLVGA